MQVAGYPPLRIQVRMLRQNHIRQTLYSITFYSNRFRHRCIFRSVCKGQFIFSGFQLQLVTRKHVSCCSPSVSFRIFHNNACNRQGTVFQKHSAANPTRLRCFFYSRESGWRGTFCEISPAACCREQHAHYQQASSDLNPFFLHAIPPVFHCVRHSLVIILHNVDTT